MQFAIYNNQRAEAEPKLKGICLHCKQEVLAKCGAKNVWHWSHTKSENCDSWSEPETQWHRDWKKLFGEDDSEIKVQKDDIYHIADVINKEGIVFEFQNSPISSEIIKTRENFYGDKMIWVINGIKFKDTFQIFDEAYLKNWKIHILDEFSATNYPALKNSLIIEDWQVKHEKVRDLLVRNGLTHNIQEKVFSLNLSEHKFVNREQFVLKLNFELLDLYKENNEDYSFGKTEFIWEHPRRSWQGTARPVFIDFGVEFLYYVNSGIGKKSGVGTKISKLKFAEKYCGN
ncbi:competence protein CoiA [Aurantibacillus circumpalustris]|uniref:competence protein CoiA n=1 Tax=Aurantibacillus circumpalustris TaxID=3036359 RepID=UPI00295B4FE8|nr:competence protein CoiA family protein [Aurantibacillus circumpalustris]